MMKQGQGVSDQENQSNPLQIEVRHDTAKLILECSHADDLFTGVVNENPYINLKIVEKVIKQKKFEVISKTRNTIQIQVYTAIFELHSQSYLLQMKIESQLSAQEEANKFLTAQIREFQANNKALEAKNQELESRLLALERNKWVEEDLDSVAPFDVSCIYKVSIGTTDMLVSASATTTDLFFYMNGSGHNMKQNNRRIVSGKPQGVTSIMKTKI